MSTMTRTRLVSARRSWTLAVFLPALHPDGSRIPRASPTEFLWNHGGQIDVGPRVRAKVVVVPVCSDQLHEEVYRNRIRFST